MPTSEWRYEAVGAEPAREYRLRRRRNGAESTTLGVTAAWEWAEPVGKRIWTSKVDTAGAVACAGRKNGLAYAVVHQCPKC